MDGQRALGPNSCDIREYFGIASYIPEEKNRTWVNTAQYQIVGQY